MRTAVFPRSVPMCPPSAPGRSTLLTAGLIAGGTHVSHVAGRFATRLPEAHRTRDVRPGPGRRLRHSRGAARTATLADVLPARPTRQAEVGAPGEDPDAGQRRRVRR